MVGHGVREGLVEPGREVAVKLLAQIGIVGDARLEQVGEHCDLGVSQQHGQFGPGEAAAGRGALTQRLVVRDELDGAVEKAALFERVDEPEMVREFGEAMVLGERERERLQVVVAEAELGDLLGHGG